MIDLGTWLFERGARRREAGIWDCGTFPSEWAMANGYPDPMTKWRGTYWSEEEALSRGSLIDSFTDGLVAHNVIAEPQTGCIGVIRVGNDEAGSIYTGKRWAFVADRGIAFSSIERGAIVKMWAV